MSLIKELVDLATQLNDSITDRKTRELFLPLKEKILEVQREQFEIEQRHAETIRNLQQQPPPNVLKLIHGFFWDAQFNPYCPACRLPLAPYAFDNAMNCLKCRTTIPLVINGKELTLAEMKEAARQSA